MNTKKVTFHQLAVICFLLPMLWMLFPGCDGKPTGEEETPDELPPSKEREKKLQYQAFNLELATEETHFYFNNFKDGVDRDFPGRLAMSLLMDACDFKCEIRDYACWIKYYECEATVGIVQRSGSSEDGDGPEPLPIASDTLMYRADSEDTEIVVYSSEPKATSFKLLTEEGEVYAFGDASTDFRYDEKKRQAIYNIKVMNPKLGGARLFIHLQTVIVNQEGEQKEIELKRPLGIDFGQ
ncbi:MAG: hypothetical protein AAGA66_12305 [Bacteroidota bacterium]